GDSRSLSDRDRELFREEGVQNLDLLSGRRRGDAPTKMLRSLQQKREGFRKIPGRRVVIRTSTATEPTFFRIDTPQPHPGHSRFRYCVGQIDDVAEFVRDVISDQFDTILWTRIYLDHVS